MAFRPYLAFAGNCREAFNRYQEIFGGELMLLTWATCPPTPGLPLPGQTPMRSCTPR
jgi:PhnB protein